MSLFGSPIVSVALASETWRSKTPWIGSRRNLNIPDWQQDDQSVPRHQKRRSATAPQRSCEQAQQAKVLHQSRNLDALSLSNSLTRSASSASEAGQIAPE